MCLQRQSVSVWCWFHDGDEWQNSLYVACNTPVAQTAAIYRLPCRFPLQNVVYLEPVAIWPTSGGLKLKIQLRDWRIQYCCAVQKMIARTNKRKLEMKRNLRNMSLRTMKRYRPPTPPLICVCFAFPRILNLQAANLTNY